MGEPGLRTTGLWDANTVLLCRRPWSSLPPTPVPLGTVSVAASGAGRGCQLCPVLLLLCPHHLPQVLMSMEAEIKRGPGGDTPESWNLGLEASVALF